MIQNDETQRLLLEMSLGSKRELREAHERIAELTRENERLRIEAKELRAQRNEGRRLLTQAIAEKQAILKSLERE